MNPYDVFNQVLTSKNLYQLADQLESFIVSLNDIKARKRVLDDCYHMLNARVFMDHRKSDNYIWICSERESVLEYLSNYWIYRRTTKETIALFESIIDQIRTQMLPPKASRISEETIEDLFDLVDRKFSYGPNVIKDKPLKILQFDYSHQDWNCFYTATISKDSSEGLLVDYIMMTCPHKVETRQEFGFVHELGHRLHTTLTNKLFTTPPSFELIQAYFKQSTENKNSEDFADCFAIAALSNSQYEDCIPFEVNPENARFLTNYMLKTISTMDGSINWIIDEIKRLDPAILKHFGML